MRPWWKVSCRWPPRRRALGSFALCSCSTVGRLDRSGRHRGYWTGIDGERGKSCCSTLPDHEAATPATVDPSWARQRRACCVMKINLSALPTMVGIRIRYGAVFFVWDRFRVFFSSGQKGTNDSTNGRTIFSYGRRFQNGRTMVFFTYHGFVTVTTSSRITSRDLSKKVTSTFPFS
jgi:hypothetical protein